MAVHYEERAEKLKKDIKELRIDIEWIGSTCTLNTLMGCAEKKIDEKKSYFCALVRHFIAEDQANIFLAAIGLLEPYRDISNIDERRLQYYKDHIVVHKEYAYPEDSLRKIEDKVINKLVECLLKTKGLPTILDGIVSNGDTPHGNSAAEIATRDKPQSKQLLEVFKPAFDRCHIEVLIKDPGSLDADLPSWVDRFVSRVQFDMEHLPDHDKTEPMYFWISHFIDIANKYNEYLKDNTELTQGMFGFRVPLHRFEGDDVSWQETFEETTTYYRQKLTTLYNQIIGNEND